MSDWAPYTLANCPFERGLLFFSNTQGIYKCSICFREFTDNQIAPFRTAQPAQEKQSTPVTGTFFQPIQPVSGTLTTTPPVNASTNLAQVGGSSVSLGPKAAANSIPVVLASDEPALAVTGTFFQPTQPVSGTVTTNAGTNLNTSLLALEAGGNLASIKADVDKIPSQGQALAAASMPVVLPATQITTLTPPTSVAVNNFPAMQPVSAASLPLAGNAAQETSGNLATIALQTRNDAQILDVLNCILAQLKLLNLNLASAIPSAHTDIDAWVMDSLPTFN